MEDRLRVGVITKTHGIRGEVKVYPTTDDPQRFKKLKKVMIEQGRKTETLEIEQVRFQKNLVILKFKGIDNINDVEKYKQCDLMIDREDAVELDDNENFVADLIGLDVITDEEEDLGTLKDVMFTGANDVYIIETDDGEEILLPAIPDCILDVDLDEEVMTVHILPGLLD